MRKLLFFLHEQIDVNLVTGNFLGFLLFKYLLCFIFGDSLVLLAGKIFFSKHLHFESPLMVVIGTDMNNTFSLGELIKEEMNFVPEESSLEMAFGKATISTTQIKESLLYSLCRIMGNFLKQC